MAMKVDTYRCVSVTVIGEMSKNFPEKFQEGLVTFTAAKSKVVVNGSTTLNIAKPDPYYNRFSSSGIADGPEIYFKVGLKKS